MNKMSRFLKFLLKFFVLIALATLCAFQIYHQRHQSPQSWEAITSYISGYRWQILVIVAWIVGVSYFLMKRRRFPVENCQYEIN